MVSNSPANKIIYTNLKNLALLTTYYLLTLLVYETKLNIYNISESIITLKSQNNDKIQVIHGL